MNFQDIIKSKKPVLVDFYADWCGPCKTMAPILKSVKDEVGDTATILKLDVDKNSKTASLYRVSSIPTLILFQNGREIWRKTGVTNQHTLVELIKKHG